MGAWLTAGGTRDNDSTDLSCNWECCGASLSEAAWHTHYTWNVAHVQLMYILSVYRLFYKYICTLIYNYAAGGKASGGTHVHL